MKQKFRIFTSIFIVCVFILTNSVQAFTNSDYYNNQNIRIGLDSMQSSQLSITLSGDYTLNGVMYKSGTSYTLKASGTQIDLNGTLYNSVTFIPQNSSNTIKIISSSSRNYLGTLTFKADSSSGTSKVLPINTLNIEYYLKGVVGKEMSDYYPIEALKAQAVAARNYAISSLGKHGTKGYDLCDTTDCQVYGGYDASFKNVIAAVDATKGILLLSGTSIVHAFYSASDGGYTELSENVWGGTYPYLTAKKDDFDNEFWPAGVRFSKSWNMASDIRNSGGTAKVSYVNGAFINFSFKGPSVKIIGLMDKYRGKAEIRIDGILVKTIDCYSATEQYKSVLFEATGLSATASHQLNITATGQKNLSSLGNTIYLDAIETANAFGETIKYEDQDTYHLKFTAKMIEDTLRKNSIYSGNIPSNYSFVKIDLNSITKYTSGRVKNITLNLKDNLGNPTSKSFSADDARTFLSLPSAMYNVVYDATTGIYTFSGKGYGHGLGMSQIGAQNRALAGQSFEDILKFYYDGATLINALPSYTVTFDSQGGSTVINKTADHGSSITAPITPTKEGYTFVGWYKEAEGINAWNFTTDKIIGNTTLYAKWIATIPATPIGFTATSTGYDSILLKWAANSVDGTSGYEVYSAPSSTGTYTLISTTTGTSYINTGLTTDSTYYYKVRAYRMASTDKVYGAFSTAISAKPLPSTPTSVKAVSSSYNSINISWSGVTGASGYEVYKATSSTGTYTLLSTITGTNYNDTGLTTNSAYYYKVREYRLVSDVKVYSDFSNMISAKPIPSTPTSVKAVSSSYNSIDISWSGVIGASGYEVFKATSSTGAYTLISTTSATNYRNTGLTTENNYYYKVRAYRMISTVKVYSNFSTVISAKPILPTPVSVKAVSSSYNSINISWSGVTGASLYGVYRATSSSGTYTLIATTTGISYKNTGLTTNSTYYYKVRAYSVVSTVKVFSGLSTTVSAKPILSAPGSVKAISSSYNSINISWSGVTGASLYGIYRATSSTDTYTLIASTTGLSYNNTGLTTNSTYYYKVRAYSVVSTVKVFSELSSTISAKPIPSAPINAKASRNSSNSIKLTWSGVTGANGYEVYRATSSTGTYSFLTSTGYLSYINSGLITGKTYYYKIRAYRTVGTIRIYSNWTPVVYATP